MKQRDNEPFLVSLDEVPRIIALATHTDLNTSWDLYNKYWEHEKDRANLKTENGRRWETMCILAFMLNVGKIHGIRSERARRKNK